MLSACGQALTWCLSRGAQGWVHHSIEPPGGLHHRPLSGTERPCKEECRQAALPPVQPTPRAGMPHAAASPHCCRRVIIQAAKVAVPIHQLHKQADRGAPNMPAHAGAQCAWVMQPTWLPREALPFCKAKSFTLPIALPAAATPATAAAASPAAVIGPTCRRMEKSWARRTRASYTAVSPCGWNLPSTSPTTRAHFLGQGKGGETKGQGCSWGVNGALASQMAATPVHWRRPHRTPKKPCWAVALLN